MSSVRVSLGISHNHGTVSAIFKQKSSRQNHSDVYSFFMLVFWVLTFFVFFFSRLLPGCRG